MTLPEGGVSAFGKAPAFPGGSHFPPRRVVLLYWRLAACPDVRRGTSDHLAVFRSALCRRSPLLSTKDSTCFPGTTRRARKRRFARPSTFNRNLRWRTEGWAWRCGLAARMKLPCANCKSPRASTRRMPMPIMQLGMTAWALSNRSSTPKQAGRAPVRDYRALAADEFKKLAALRPKDASVRQILVEIDLEEGRKEAAFADGQEAVRLAPDNPDPHMVLGRAYFAGGEEEKAVAEYEKALKLNPKIGEAYLALGQIRFFQQRYPQAEEYFQQAIRLSPNLAPAYTGLAQILTQHHRLAEARNMLEKAVALDPQDWQSQYLLAASLNETGETGRATDLLEKISELHPDFLPAREQLVMGLIRRGELKQATAKVDALIAEEPQAAEGHRPRALILWKQHNFEGALAECAMALDTQPDSASMLALQAICLWQFARKRDSQAAYRQAVKIESRIGTSEVFCRLVLCDARDIGIVEDFLRRNRWVIAPPPPAP